MKIIGGGIVILGSFILLMTGIIYLNMDHCEVTNTKITHDSYKFDFPMSLLAATTYFNVDSISRRAAVRYDKQEWLKVKVIQNYRDQTVNDPNKILISGVNFYYNDTAKKEQTMKKLEQKWGFSFEARPIAYANGDTSEWWQMELNCRVSILVYQFRPSKNLMGEKEYGSKGMGKQYVVAYVFNQPPKFQLAQYVKLDGLTDIDYW